MIHSKLLQVGLFVFILISTFSIYSQNIILHNAYAHNDYWHKRPLHDALNNGFTYIEADVFLRGDKLIVAHILPLFKKKRTLEQLYLKPLLEYVTNNRKQPGINEYPITLMIDIKTDANKTYQTLVLLLEKYKSILTSYENGKLYMRSVTIVLTGHRPYGIIKTGDNHLAFIDEDLKQTGRDTSSNMYTIASCKYSSLLKWKGKGDIPDRQRKSLEYYVAQAHKHGRKVRLWASPENKAVWHELLKCNVDLINTDNLNKLRDFLISDLLLVAKTE